MSVIRAVKVCLLALALCLPMAAQDASPLNTQLVTGLVGPVTYNTATHVLTFSNRVDVSTPMVACSQYNMYGQCQGSPQSYYHTATGSVSVTNVTRGTVASNSDQKYGAVMDASISIIANPGDTLRVSETQTIYCPMVAQMVVNTSILDFHVEIAATMAISTGGAPTNCKQLGGQTYCVFNAQPWCTDTTTPPDKNVIGVQWPLADGPKPFWLTFAACVSPNGHQPWGCTPGIAVAEPAPQMPYLCTSNR
jgi:hypothetical protein